MPLTGKTPDHPKGAAASIPDAILAQILAVSTNSKGLPVTGVVMAPDVYAAISTEGDRLGDLCLWNAYYRLAADLLWGRAMAVNPAMAAGTALVGSFGYGATLAIKGGMRIAMTNSDASDFTKNLVAVRAELRVALTPSVPAAFGLVMGLVAS